MGRIDKFTFGLLVVSVALNIALALKLQGMKMELRRDQNLAEGTVIDGLEVASSGRRVQLQFKSPGKSTVVYIFSPACPWCGVNRDRLVTLAKAQKANFNFVGISLTTDGLDAYLKTNPFPFEVYTGLRNSDILKYHFGTTPQTIVIGPDGRVVKSWLGAYIGPTQDEVAAFFGSSTLSLPR